MECNIRRSLRMKVAVLVTGISLLVFIGLFFINSSAQEKHNMEQLQSFSVRLMALLQMAVNEPMAVGDNKGTVAQFNKLGQNFAHIKVHLTNYKGNITYSTDPAMVRKDLLATFRSSDSSGTLSPMVEESLSAPVRRGSMVTLDGTPYYAQVLSIRNEASCHHCHGRKHTILGSMVLMQDIDKEMSGLRASQRSSALVSLAGLLLLLVLLHTFMRKSVISRVKALATCTEKVRKGDLNQDFLISGVDELGCLGQDLHFMVAELKSKMSEAQQNAALASEEAKRAHLAMEDATEAQAVAKRLSLYQKREVDKLSDALKHLARGDLNSHYIAGRADEDLPQAHESFKEIEQAMTETTASLKGMIAAMKDQADVLVKCSHELAQVSTDLSGSSEDLSLRAGTVAGASEEISTNISTMAAATEEISTNIHSVSSTAEEMSMTMNNVAQAIIDLRKAISSIAEYSQEGAEVAMRANNMATSATSTMSQLGDAARDIGKVTEVIKRIAEQTNLLALNATIEAASAGESGKGFAVVAHEIKELANQSAKAAEDIADKIAGVQKNAQAAVKVMEDISTIIDAINSQVRDITRNVEQQDSAANEITLSITETSKGADDIAKAISELAKGANDMSCNAGDISKGASDMSSNILSVSKTAEIGSSGAKRVNSLADQLTRVADMLQAVVRKFTL